MKKILLFSVLFVFSTQVILSQEKELETDKSPQQLEEYYTMKFKKKRKTARIFLISGVSVMAVGVGFTVATLGYGVEYGAGAVAIGAVSTLASIPFYIKAKSYKKKAAGASTNLIVSIGTIRQPNSNNLALGFSYNF